MVAEHPTDPQPVSLTAEMADNAPKFTEMPAGRPQLEVVVGELEVGLHTLGKSLRQAAKQHSALDGQVRGIHVDLHDSQAET